MTSSITGDAELRRKLAKLQDMSQIYPALMAGGVHVAGKLKEYPPSTAANVPRTVAGSGKVLSWYERGYGTRWLRKDGSMGGNKTSETLGKKWTMQGSGGDKVIIGNNVSYGPWVQGSVKVGGVGPQASALREIGWKTTDTVASEEAEVVLNMVKKEVDKILMSG